MVRTIFGFFAALCMLCNLGMTFPSSSSAHGSNGCGGRSVDATTESGVLTLSAFNADCAATAPTSPANTAKWNQQDQQRLLPGSKTKTAPGPAAVAKPDPTNGRITGSGSWNGRGPNPCANTIRNLGGFCIPPTAPAAPGQPAVPAPLPPPPVVITAQEFKTLPLKERTTMCSCTPDENNKPSGVVTVPIAFWQDAETETITTTLLGQIVQVQATPTQWAYNFDNGQTLTYNAQYSVNGGPWQPIHGTGQRPDPSLASPIKSFVALEDAPNY